MNDLKLSVKLTADGRQFITVVDSAKKEIGQLSGELNTSQGASRNAARGLQTLEQQGQQTALKLSTIAKSVSGVFAAMGVATLASSASQELMAFQDLRTRLQQLSGTEAAYADNQAYLIQLSKQHHKEITALGDSYAGLLNLQDAGLVNQRQARSILEGMSNVQSALGASSEQLGQAMYGLSQALASPVIKAEDFNQVMEPLPGLMNKMDKAAGVGAGGIRKMVLAGQMTSAMFRDYLIKALNEYQGAAAKTGDNLSAMYRDNKNAYQQMVVAYEQPINDSLAPILKTSAIVMQTFADNVGTVSTAVETVMAVAMARGTVAVGAHTISLINNAVASERTRAAAVKEAEAELARATALRASVYTAGQAVVAEERLAKARAAVAAATAEASIASRAYTGVTSLLGGWPGLILMAATGWVAFSSGANNAADNVGIIDDRVKSLLGNINDLTRTQLDSKIRALQSQYQLQLSGINDIDQKIQKLESNRQYGQGQYADVQSQIDSLKQQRQQLENERDAISKTMQQIMAKIQGNTFNNIQWQGGGNDAPKTDPALTKQAESMLSNLQKQVTLYGSASESAKLFYEIEAGSLQKLDQPMKEKLIKAAADLDAQKAAEEQTKKNKQAEDERAAVLQKLLGNIDPVTVAAKQYADQEKLLKDYFEKANVPLAERTRLLANLKNQYEASTPYSQLRNQLDPAYAENQTHTNNLDTLNSQLANTPEDEVAKRAEINALIEAEQQRHATAMTDINSSISFNWNQMWQDSVDRMTSGIGAATADALFEAKNFGDGVQETVRGVAKSIVQMMVEWAARKAVMFAMDKMFASSGAQTNQAIAVETGTGIAAAYAPAAAMASLASFGGNSIPAMAGMGATAALAETLSIVGIAHDGLPLNRDEGTYLLRQGEMVLNPKQRDNFEYMVDYAKGGNAGANQLNLTVSPTIVVQKESQVSEVQDLLPQIVKFTTAAVVENMNMRGEAWTATR
ncbi:tape measure protein [Shewanella yunxiaonensis]|uniref:Tape measure protein n=1 Tax=Shewanella yunxiaonensis TaxID=2829809 RepID=A0ABX7YVA2_9GAMM|nr:tape measure protein [Shewanella yunxiaonensis]QUN06428.1 tape measure protein [Shewanella yunxiaonensis]